MFPIIDVTGRVIGFGGRALAELDAPDAAAVAAGLPNLDRHLESASAFGKKPVVALNRFPTDRDDEVAVVRDHVLAAGFRFAESRHYMDGGDGAVDLAREIVTRSSLPELRSSHSARLVDDDSSGWSPW